MNFVKCVRVYNNGSRVVENLTPEEAEKEAAYNKVMRFGVAYFVNGKCTQTGYLSQERCDAIEKELSS